MSDTVNDKRIAIWLLSGCFLIFSMVVIGGITRLTGSGLSITEWDPIMGAVPPMNDQEWSQAFEKYKQIPQFTQVNSYFTLEDFKSIFWWEFIHRLVGRLIGVVFILPFLWFLIRKQMRPELIRKSLFLFGLGGLQGFLGWFMVKSGLTELTSVSHIRLAIHLFTAFMTFGFTFWFALQLLEPPATSGRAATAYRWSVVFISVLLVQLIYGALVAGLHAGQYFNTFPLMNGKVVPEEAWVSNWGIRNIHDNPVTVQFIHRFFAFTLLFITYRLFRKTSGDVVTDSQRRAFYWLLAAISVQFLLGMFTVLYHAPISLSSVHQIGAFFVFMAALLLMFRLRPAKTL